MTTDQPRAGGPDATPEPGATAGRAEATDPGPVEPDTSTEAGRSVPGPRITGAGTPPPGPATSGVRPRPAALPIAGAGVPPPRPAPRPVPPHSAPAPIGSTSPSRPEVERARTGPLTEPSDAQPPTRPAGRRRFAPRWLRRRTDSASRTADAASITASTPGSPSHTAATTNAAASTTAATPATSTTPATTTTAGAAAATSTTTAATADPGAMTGEAAAGKAASSAVTLARPAASSPRKESGIALDERPATSTSPPKTAADTHPTGAAPSDPLASAGDAPNPPPATSRPTGRKRRKPLPADRPPGAPPDPWTAFATTEERTPGRIRRGLRRLGRALIHEYALATYAALLLAIVMTWPTLRYPLHTVPQDVFDPARQAWQVAWAGHVLLTDPVQLWQANAFFPERYSFAYGNSLLGYAPAGMIGTGPTAAILRYNILFVLAYALLALGGYALVRQLGIGRTGAAVAAAAFAYAPWRLAQAGHLDIISAGGIPLALAMLARGHGWSMRHGLRPERRHAGWAAAGWLVAAWQVSLGFSLGLPFAYVLAGIILVVAVAAPIRRWRRRAAGPALGWRLSVTDLLGVLIFAGIGALIAIPYFRAPDTGSRIAEIEFFSPPLRGLLIGPAESRIWGGPHAVPRSSLGWPAEMSLLPGFVLYALALVGLVFSVWKLWQRLLLVLGVAVAVVLTLGTTFLDGRWTYLPLFGHLPASFGVRIPGRLVLWVTLLLAILAAGAVAEFVRRAEHLVAHRTPPWPSPWLRLAMLVPLVLVLVESWSAIAHPVVPAQPAAMRTVNGPMLVLPTAALGDQTVMLWSTSRFQPIANGAGGFAAGQQAELRQAVATFPDAASVQYLRETGVSTVLLVRSQVAGTPWELSGDIPVEALGIRREDLDDDTVLFRLD